MLNVRELLDRISDARAHAENEGTPEALAWRPYVTMEPGRGLVVCVPVRQRPWAGWFAGKRWIVVPLRMESTAQDEEERIDGLVLQHMRLRLDETSDAINDLVARVTVFCGITGAAGAMVFGLVYAAVVYGGVPPCDVAAHLLRLADTPADEPTP